MNAGKLCLDTILKCATFTVGRLERCLPLFRILNHVARPSGALIVFVQLKIIDKSEGSCSKLTTPYFVVVIILSGSRGVVKRRVLFVFLVLRLSLCQLMAIARCDSHAVCLKGNEISQAGTG